MKRRSGFLVVRFEEPTRTDFYLRPIEGNDDPEPVIRNVPYKFGPVLLKHGRILALTDWEAPNLRIVEVCRRRGSEAEFLDVVPCSDLPIQDWTASDEWIFVFYLRELQTEIKVFDPSGVPIGHIPVNPEDTTRLLGGSQEGDELFLEQESFTKPIQLCRYSTKSGKTGLWAERKVPFEARDFSHTQTWFTARDGTHIPIFLVGHRDVLGRGAHPTIMTSYGAHGISMTPQFSAFVAVLLERGCLFALPNIRGGSEFGTEWHHAARRRHRQVAFDDFLSAAEWLALG